MLNEDERRAIRNRIADFCVDFSDMIDDENKSGALDTMENFYNFFCGALIAAKRDGKREALTTTTN